MSRKSGVIFSFILMAVEVLSNFLFVPFLLKIVGTSIYGVYSLSLTFTSYLALLDLGLGNALIKYMSKAVVDNDDEQLNSFIGFSWIFYIIIALIIFVIGLPIIFLVPSLFSKGLTGAELDLAQKLMVISTLNISFTFFFIPFDKLILAKRKYVLQKILQIINIFVRIGLSVIFLVSGLGIVFVAMSTLFVTILFGASCLIISFVKFKIRPKFKRRNKAFFKEVFSYTGIILISMIATQINNMLDQILIGAFITSASTILAVYSIGTQIYHHYQTLSNCVNGILMPEVVRLVKNNPSPESMRKEFVKVSRIVFMILALVLITFSIEGKNFIRLWVGDENSDAYYVSIILMASITFSLCQSIGVQMMWATNNHKEHAFIKLGIVMLNAILTYFLMLWNPLIGAALGTGISIFLGDVVLTNIVFRVKLKINLIDYYIEFFKGLLPTFIITLAIGFFVNTIFEKYIFLNTIFEFVLVCAIIVLSYAVCLFMSFNVYEKKQVITFCNKFGLLKKRS